MNSEKKKQMTDWDNSSDMTMEEFDQAISASFAGDDLRPGDKVTGTIISISESTVFLDINAKSEGIIALEEFVDEEGTLTVRPGDEVNATVIRTGDEIQLSFRMRKRDQTLEMLREAHNGQIAVEGRVEQVNKGGFDISLGGTSAFCPVSQIDTVYVEEPAAYLHGTYHFLITKMDPKGRNIVVSRSRLLEIERAKAAQETLKNLKPGAILSGEVRRIADYGAFVDIGGIDGMVHISQISWDRLKHPSDALVVGQEVRVKVMKIDGDTQRISLSMREVQEKPWDEFVGSEIMEGNTYPGEVMRVEHFGAFVKLKPGLEGLLHISELKYGRRINHPSEVVSPGDSVFVKVIGLDHDKHQISLSMKQTGTDPWELNAAQLIPENLLFVEIAKIKSVGLEVTVDNSLVGFIPASLSGVGPGESLTSAFTVGDTIRVKVVEADQSSRRLIFEVSDAEKEETAADINSYMADSRNTEQASFGSLGALLQKALDKKKKN